MNPSNLLIVINASTLAAILIFGYRVVRFINRIEFRTDEMWEDYEYRTKGRERRKGFVGDQG